MVLFETNWKRNISTKASKKAPYSIPIRTILVQKRCSWVPSFEVINQIIKMSVLIFIVSIHENIFLIHIKISWLTKLVADFKKKCTYGNYMILINVFVVQQKIPSKDVNALFPILFKILIENPEKKCINLCNVY